MILSSCLSLEASTAYSRTVVLNVKKSGVLSFLIFPPAGVIVAHCRLSKLHVVDVHVCRAHAKLADVRVEGELLEAGTY